MESFSVSRASNKYFEPGTPIEVINSVQDLINAQIDETHTLEDVVHKIELMHGTVELSEEGTFDMLIGESGKSRCHRFTAQDGAYGLIHIHEEKDANI